MNWLIKNKKNFFFSFIALFSVLLAAEASLRLCHFKFKPPFSSLENRNIYEIADQYRIFETVNDNIVTKKQYEGWFHAQCLLSEKPHDEFRLFILGGSSIYRLLTTDRLNDLLHRSSEKKINIINLGGNSYGSTRLLMVFHEILNYDPDVVLIYSGHNEFEEKHLEYRITSESRQKKTSVTLLAYSRFLQLIEMGLYRLGLTMMNSNRNFNLHSISPNFPLIPKEQRDVYSDKQEVHEQYKNNLLQMINTAHENNVKIILSTVAYNRMDPPFEPGNNLHKRGITLYEEGQYAKAFQYMEEGLDADLQPHRASTVSNNIARALSKKFVVPLADIDSEIISQANNHVPGPDLFIDHCHLNDRGNTILQNVFFETIITNFGEQLHRQAD